MAEVYGEKQKQKLEKYELPDYEKLKQSRVLATSPKACIIHYEIY